MKIAIIAFEDTESGGRQVYTQDFSLDLLTDFSIQIPIIGDRDISSAQILGGYIKRDEWLLVVVRLKAGDSGTWHGTSSADQFFLIGESLYLTLGAKPELEGVLDDIDTTLICLHSMYRREVFVKLCEGLAMGQPVENALLGCTSYSATSRSVDAFHVYESLVKVVQQQIEVATLQSVLDDDSCMKLRQVAGSWVQESGSIGSSE